MILQREHRSTPALGIRRYVETAQGYHVRGTPVLVAHGGSASGIHCEQHQCSMGQQACPRSFSAERLGRGLPDMDWEGPSDSA